MGEEKTYACLIAVEEWLNEGPVKVAVNGIECICTPLGFAHVHYSFVKMTAASAPGAPTNDINVPISEIQDGKFWHQKISNEKWRGQVSVCRQMNDLFESKFEKMPVIGHRGCGQNGMTPGFEENTITSFLEARRRGAQGIETDLHLTTDGRIVIWHDDIRCGKEIRACAYADLCDPETGKGPLLLKDVLDGLPNDFGLNLEMKCLEECKKGFFDIGGYSMQLAAATMAFVRKYPQKKILFSSFSLAACIYTRMLNSACSVCLLVHNKLLGTVPNDEMNDALVVVAEKTELNGFVLSSEVIDKDEDVVNCATNQQLDLYAYGRKTNTREDAQHLMSLKFNGLITDHIDVIHGVI